VDSNGRRSHVGKRTPAIATTITLNEGTETDHRDATAIGAIASTNFATVMAPRHVEVGMMRETPVATEEAGTTIDISEIVITAAIEMNIPTSTTIAGINLQTANRHETRSD
jgi:hypothetical protein